MNNLNQVTSEASFELVLACKQLLYRLEAGLSPNEFDSEPIQDEVEQIKQAIDRLEGRKP